MIRLPATLYYTFTLASTFVEVTTENLLAKGNVLAKDMWEITVNTGIWNHKVVIPYIGSR